jgi:hypothetical protein
VPRLFGGSEGSLGAGGDHAGLEFGNGRHLLQQKAPGWSLDCREVGEAHIDAGLQQSR